MRDEERWDLHEVPTHFDTEDRWIFGRYTTTEGIFGLGVAGAAYLLYDFLPDLGVTHIREIPIPITALIALASFVILFLVFVERWNGERVITKLWRRIFFRIRPKKTVWKPRSDTEDRRLVAEAIARSEQEDEDEE